MRGPIRWLGLAAFLAFAAGGFLACGGGGNVKVGAALPLTGEHAKGGKEVLNGVLLAADEWNQKGGVLGKKIEVIQGDDEGRPERAKTLAQELCDQGVRAVIGHYNSGCSLAASEVYAKNRVVMITPSSTTPEVTDRGLFTIFRVCGRDDKQGAMAADYAAKSFPDAKVAILHDKTEYGQDLANEFQKNWEFITKRERAYYGSLEKGQPDYASLIATLGEAGATVVYFGGTYQQAGPLLKALRVGGVKAAFMTGDGCFDQQFPIDAGFENAEGALVSFSPDPAKSPNAAKTIESYRKRFGDPGPYSLFAYDAANILFSAVGQAGSLDPVKIAQTLHSASLQSIFGPFKFDDKGDPAAPPYVMWRVSGGKFVEAPNPGSGTGQ